MFSWFRTTSPLDESQQIWLELRVNWLLAHFGERWIRDKADLLPTHPGFPKDIPDNEKDLQAFLEFLCRYLEIDPAEIELHVVSDEAEDGEGAGGPQIYEVTVSRSRDCGVYYKHPHKPNIGVIELSLQEFSRGDWLAATLIHELCHHLLHGAGLLEDEWDDEEVTDLLAALLGAGLFAANSCVTQNSRIEGLGFEYWSIRRRGYLPARCFGYVFALRDKIRGHQNPELTSRLLPDVGSAYHKAWKYLNKTDECLCPGKSGRPFDKGGDADRLLTRLRSEDSRDKKIAWTELRILGDINDSVREALLAEIEASANITSDLAEAALAHADDSKRWRQALAQFLVQKEEAVLLFGLNVVQSENLPMSLKIRGDLSIRDRIESLCFADSLSLVYPALAIAAQHRTQFQDLLPKFKSGLLAAIEAHDYDHFESVWMKCEEIAGSEAKALKRMHLSANEKRMVKAAIKAIDQ